MSTDSIPSGIERGTRCRRERIVIAVLTYRRPEDLGELLPMLIDQARGAGDGQHTIEILVIDNDEAPSAAAVVQTAAAAAGRRDVPVRYVHEPFPGISAARNRALDEALDDDILIFIDDDERPGADWLAQLLRTHEQFGADVVQGPVDSQFEVEPESWLLACGFLHRRRLETGTQLDVAVTNNLLLDLHVVRKSGIRFDPELGTSGGEDTLFTRQLHRAGASMVWCAEAIVYDVVPASRATRSWVRQRAVSTGNATAIVTLKLNSGAIHRTIARVALTGRGIARIVSGAARIGVGRATRSEVVQGRATRTMLRGVGMALGAWGYAYLEYARDGGPRLTRVGSTPSVRQPQQVEREVDHVG